MFPEVAARQPRGLVELCCSGLRLVKFRSRVKTCSLSVKSGPQPGQFSSCRFAFFVARFVSVQSLFVFEEAV